MGVNELPSAQRINGFSVAIRCLFDWAAIGVMATNGRSR